MVEVITDGLTGASIVAGLWAVWLWWSSTRMFPFNPQWGIGKEPVTSEPAWRAETALFMQAVVRARDLTGRAALWAAVAITLHAIATVFGHLSMPG
ncbi:hypothetical protein [Lichenibacterium dinghuense]|uniref:hypothetical protein n=1 Tax=Lichenibacterium dinghuense TaxID=2895977 RepID=UPI001F1D08DB|nr:hypothetical protein [Lichenibacterium sp. 6Y81]